MRMSDIEREKSWMEETADDLRESHGFNYFVVAQSTIINEDGSADVLHMVGYPEPPSTSDLDGLVAELAEDNELGMTGLIFTEDYVFFNLDDIKETVIDK